MSHPTAWSSFGLASGHFVALALSITAVGLAARALVSAPRDVSGT